MCESLYGHWTFAAVYVISGVAASLTSVWWRPVGVSAGASGAIFGIVGALIASHYLGDFSGPRFAVRARLRSVLTFAAYALLFGAVSGRTDNAAHIGGLVTGLLLGALIARVAPEREPLRRGAVLLFVGLAVFGSLAALQRSRTYLIHLSRGADLLEQNKTDQAIVELRTATCQHPEYVPAHFALAHAYFETSQYALAESELKRVLELQPRDGAARYELGMTYLHQQRIPEAKDTFAELVRADKEDAYAHLGLGMALAAQDQQQDALDEFKKAAKLDPDLSSVFYQMGRAEAKLKHYDEAIADFRKQQDNAGDDFDTESALSSSYQAKGMTAEAKDAVQKAEKLKPSK
jgi:tetratricopeptide (TPR) repeat protein